MKILSLAFAICLSIGSAFGAAYSTGFGDAPGDYPFDPFDVTPPFDIPPQDGWGINDGAADLSGLTANFFNGTGTSYAAVLGGIFNVPAVNDVQLFHGYGMQTAGTTFSVQFQIDASFDDTPSGGVDATGVKDDFGFSFLSSGSPILTIGFESATAAASNQLEFVYYDNLGTRNRVPLPSGLPGSGSDIIYNGFYELEISFAADGASTSVDASLTPLIGTTVTFSDTLSVAPATSLDTVGVDWKITDPNPANAGNNQIIFDNFSVIPEPSITLSLAFMAMFALVTRRRVS